LVCHGRRRRSLFRIVHARGAIPRRRRRRRRSLFRIVHAQEEEESKLINPILRGKPNSLSRGAGAGGGGGGGVYYQREGRRRKRVM
jgi:hypothetical protein